MPSSLSYTIPRRRQQSLSRSDFRSVPSLPKVIHELRQRQQPPLRTQLEELQQLRQRLTIITLYKDLFPSQYRKQSAHKRRLNLSNYIDHLFPSFIDAIIRFYFPVMDWDVDYIRERFPYIPLTLVNYDIESDFEHEPLPYRVTAHLVGHYSYAPSQDELRQLLPAAQFPSCWNREGHWCHINFPTLDALCSKHRSPVRHFPKLFLTLAHDTGSPFLDPSYDSGEWDDDGYRWDKNTIIDLKRQWDHTKAILKRNEQTARALENNPSYWNTIFRYWEDSCTPL